MRNGQRTNPGPVDGFRLSLGAYVSLTQIRDQLRLLGDLAVPVGESADDRIALSAEALADCFVRIAEDLEVVIEDAEPVPA
jgi:hypothetical protein